MSKHLPYKGDFTVSQAFMEVNPKYKSGRHQGIDLVGILDKTIYGVEDGTVHSVAYSSGYGHHVIVAQTDGLYAWYNHLSAVRVVSGQIIRGGVSVIGIEGRSGNVYGGADPRHLDLRLSKRSVHSDNPSDYTNPAAYLSFENKRYIIVKPQEEEKDVKLPSIVLYATSTDGKNPDKRAAEYWADHINCKVVLPLNAVDAAYVREHFEQAYIVGSSDKITDTCINICGEGRHDTCRLVLTRIEGKNA